MVLWQILCILIVLFQTQVQQLFEGVNCTKDGKEGICRINKDCPSALNDSSTSAVLGFEENNDNKTSISWICSGTLINDKWILTAEHCTYNRKTGSSVSHVRLGGEDLNSKAKPEYLYRVKTIIVHPNITRPKMYNDIALLELDRQVIFSDSVIPACLHAGEPIIDAKVTAVTYGKIHYHPQNKMLMKIMLNKYSHLTCALKYNPMRKLPRGIDETTQICYGSNEKSFDSCQYTTGGPIQIDNKDVYCTYKIIGILSFGNGCGYTDMPNVYTKVSAYIPWIESIAWP